LGLASVAHGVKHLLEHNAPPSKHTPLHQLFQRQGPLCHCRQHFGHVKLLRSHAWRCPRLLPSRRQRPLPLRWRCDGPPLCAHVDSDTIPLIGRWCSDEMLRYLTVFKHNQSCGNFQPACFKAASTPCCPMLPFRLPPFRFNSATIYIYSTFSSLSAFPPTQPFSATIHSTKTKYWRHTAPLQAPQRRS
jgi:hypothetical protein